MRIKSAYYDKAHYLVKCAIVHLSDDCLNSFKPVLSSQRVTAFAELFTPIILLIEDVLPIV